MRLSTFSTAMHTSFAWAIFPPLFIVLGILFHLYQFVGLIIRKMKQENLFLFFIFLAVMDCTALCTSLLHLWLTEVLLINIRTTSEAVCQFHLWLSGLALDIPPWLLVAMTYEKRAFLWYPVPADSQFSRSTVKMVLGGIFLIFALRNLHVISYSIVTTAGSDDTKPGNGSSVRFECDLSDTATTVFLRLFSPWLNFFIRVMSPFLCLVVYHAFIMRKIRRENFCAERLMEKVGIEAPLWFYAGLMEVRHTVRRTAVLTIIIFLCGLPFSLYFIYKAMTKIEGFKNDAHTWEMLGSLLYFINYSWLYALFTIHDHSILTTLRDTWRGPLVKKRGTNVASVAPSFTHEPQKGNGIRCLLAWLFRNSKDNGMEHSITVPVAVDVVRPSVSSTSRRDSGIMPESSGSQSPARKP
ncbi:hypothetical protein ACOMHN_006951 [Nucella lapillus]